MSETLRDLLARGAEPVERPVLDVGELVAQAERRLVRRRIGAAAAVAASVAVVVAGGLALRPSDERLAPAPTAPTPAPTRDPEPALGPAIYFDALAVKGDALTDPVRDIAGQKDIYLTREGGPARQIIATSANEHCPRVSPEGDMLAYLEGRSVVVRHLNATGDAGATAVRVELGRRQVTCPQWSPEGRRLAVATAGYDSPDQVIEVRVIEVGGTEHVVATQRHQWMPLPEIAWSPDGDAIAFTTPDSVWVAPIGGGQQEMLWRGRPRQAPTGFPPYPGRPVGLSWLGTGEVAVSTQTDVDGVDALHVVDPGSGHDAALGTFRMDVPPTWSWSPDGSRLVFADHDGGARMFDRTSGKTERVGPRLEGQGLPIWKLAWSADGRRLVGTAADTDPSTTVFALVSMGPDGSSVDVLTPWTLALYSEADVSWSPR